MTSPNVKHIPAIVNSVRKVFNTQKTKDVTFRREQLNGLLRLIDEQEDLIAASIKKDFGKPYYETVLTETEYTRNCIKGALLHLDEWIKPKPIPKSIVTLTDQSYIKAEPFGVVLIIAPWNYPIQLVLAPLIGAISAGNCAIIKPSELTPSCATFLADILPRYIDPECYAVVNGGAEETQALLNERFDYIFYTGSTTIGRLIYIAAAKHLTPVTLELGGKSPVYLDGSVGNFEFAVRRILWGKCINAGQTCIAPDYILCAPEHQENIVAVAKQVLKTWYGDDANTNPDYTKIVNERHFKRVEQLLQKTKGTIALGGKTDASTNSIEPTVVTNVQFDDELMKEEIFGPILPIVSISSPEEAIAYINRGEKPLTMYLFTTDKNVTEKFLNETSAGSVCANDTVIHLTRESFSRTIIGLLPYLLDDQLKYMTNKWVSVVDGLPFGGVGSSGIGAYHGSYSFDTFSHRKPILIRGYDSVLEAIAAPRYPPYTEDNLYFMNSLLAKTKSSIPLNLFFVTKKIIVAVAGVVRDWFRSKF